MTSSIDVGGVISQVFDLYKRYAGVLLPVAAVLFLVVGIVEWLVDDSILLTFLVSILATIATYFYTGMVVNLVDDVRDGRLDQSVGQLFGRVTPVLAPLILASILAAIGIGIGLILLIVPGLILMTLWAVVAPVILVERTGVFAAFSRSMALVKGSAWQVFAVIVIFFLIAWVVSILLAAIGVAGGDGLRALLYYIGRVITAPLGALAAAVMFFDLKAIHGEAAPASTPAAPAGPASSSAFGDPA